MVALVILAFGSYFARVIGNTVAAYGRNIHLQDAELLGSIARYAIVTFVVLIALDQVNVGGDIMDVIYGEVYSATDGNGVLNTFYRAVKPVQIIDTPALGVALFQLEYRETPPGKPPTRQESMLTLVFQPRNGKWVMVLDQNTPVR